MEDLLTGGGTKESGLELRQDGEDDEIEAIGDPDDDGTDAIMLDEDWLHAGR